MEISVEGETIIPIEESNGVIESMQRRVNEIRKEKIGIPIYRRGRGNQLVESGGGTPMYRFPHSLTGIHDNSVEPEIVSIGPYHRGKEMLSELETSKWRSLSLLLSRTEPKGVMLSHFTQDMKDVEIQARACYPESIPMSSADFVEMMILDGCFVVELLRQVSGSLCFEWPILCMPCLIPIIVRDLLKLENQLPFFVLQRLFNRSKGSHPNTDSLSLLVIKLFELVIALPMPFDFLKMDGYAHTLKPSHLLDLYHLCFSHFCFSRVHAPSRPFAWCLQSLWGMLLQNNQPIPKSNSSIQCVTHLRSSGVKFSPGNSTTENFLLINFRKGVLEIPSITINDSTITALINCAALEQCKGHRQKPFSTYIAFMSCLIHSAKDVAFLCGDGIIENFSHNDQRLVILFKLLGENIIFHLSDCYLYQQFLDVGAYYNSNWAILKRTYFSNPWTSISIFSASALLLLTVLQTIIAVLSYIDRT